MAGSAALAAIRGLDRLAVDLDFDLSIGPLIEDDRPAPDFPSWAADLAAATSRIFWSVSVAGDQGVSHPRTMKVAAATIARLARVGQGGEANFRFAAAAGIRPSTPFFPVAYHQGPPAFSLALESATLVAEAFEDAKTSADAAPALRTVLEDRLSPLEGLAKEIAQGCSHHYAGLDLSPAPSLNASIAAPIERLAGVPFGAPATLSACAAITRGVETTALERCGYSGLMLPVLEDRVLAQRAIEGRFGIENLLLYSSVCGTGLDLVPLPGDCSERVLGGLILDVAALSARWNKPLAARLLPIPGKVAGDPVDFVNPHLTGSIVLGTG